MRTTPSTSSKKGPVYSADITKGALMIPESRVVANVLLQSPQLSSAEWEAQVVRENMLQKRSPVTARSRARYLRARLSVGPATLLPLLARGDTELAAQAAMALAIKHSRLLGDYLDQVVRLQRLRQQPSLVAKDWAAFLDNAEGYAPEVHAWSTSTRQKLGQVVHQAMSEAGYLADTKSKRLQPVRVRAEIRRVLDDAREEYVLRCLGVAEA